MRGGTELATFNRSGSFPAPKQSTQASKQRALSVLSISPASTEKVPSPSSSSPSCEMPPVYVMLDTVTPSPSKTFVTYSSTVA